MEKKVTIVYYGFINPKIQWWNIIGGQLQSLKKTGLLEKAELHIHLTGQIDRLLQATVNILAIIPDCIINTSVDNKYEYPGLHLLWELANKKPDNIFLYFHSKGISYSKSRSLDELILFQEVIMSWQKVIGIFDNDATINKIGFTAAEPGWLWFNFWWARGSYLSICEEPKVSSDRYYYEGWLHSRLDGNAKTSNDCYSLADNKKGIFYSPYEAVAKLGLIKLIN